MSDTLKGILLIVFAALVFSVSDAVGKVFAQDYNALMVSWGRFVFGIASLPMVVPLGGLAGVARTGRLGLHLVRSVMIIGANTCFFIGLRHIPLADAMAIGFVAPLITCALAIPLLGERVARPRWAAIGVGFLGMLVILRPGLEVRHWAYVMPLVSALFWSLYVILTRKLAATESPLTLLFYAPLAGAVALSVAAPTYWLTPQGADWAWLALIGVLATVGHFALVRAYHAAAASLLAPFGYVNIVFGTVLGYVVFGSFPDAFTILGTLIVVASGLALAFAETRGGAKPGDEPLSLRSTSRRSWWSSRRRPGRSRRWRGLGRPRPPG